METGLTQILVTYMLRDQQFFLIFDYEIKYKYLNSCCLKIITIKNNLFDSRILVHWILDR